MNKIRVAVVGYGNIGQYAIASLRDEEDMEIAGVVRRKADRPEGLSSDIPVVSDVRELGKVDVALLAIPSRSVPEYAKEYLALGINTVDSFDIHGDELLRLWEDLNEVGREHGSTAVICAGWDPGTDSVVRLMFEYMAPRGITYTNFGPGMSMGHSVAVKAIKGVRDALSMTLPLNFGVHRRAVYVELEEGAEFERVKEEIMQDPYFVKDETHVYRVDDVKKLIDMGHGVVMERSGAAGMTENQTLKLVMRINNPALTAQVMVASARATMRQKPGAYTLPEIAAIDMLPGDKSEWIRRFI